SEGKGDRREDHGGPVRAAVVAVEAGERLARRRPRLDRDRRARRHGEARRPLHRAHPDEARARRGEPTIVTESRHVQLPIEEVSISEDRAQVRRSGRIAFDAGTNLVTVDGVSPVLSDKTLAVSL